MVKLSRKAFEQTVSRHSDDLYRFAFWLCHDRSVAEDLVQETWIRAWRYRHQLRDPAAARSWLLTTLRRENARRFERKQLELVALDERTMPDSQAGSQEQVHLTRQLQRAIAGLPQGYREALVLQALMGCSIREIAAITELTPSAVMTRVFRAREKLRRRLGRRPDAWPQVA